MLQSIVAIIIILFFLSKVIVKRRNNDISRNEFLLWLIFWLTAGFAVIFLKRIDSLVSSLGFSGSGIDILLYLGIAVVFYFIFRMRLRLEKIEQNITKLVREISLLNKNKK
ncbi:DUF2304 domain-containing protein [bacterium]|nr:DUF2304 domain-containing protein [bacterium]